MIEQSVTLTMTPDEALVLFEWLTRLVDEGIPSAEHEAERRVLSDLQTMLEAKLTAPLDPEYVQILASARQRVLSEK